MREGMLCCTDQGNAGRELPANPKRLERYPLAPKLCQEAAAAVQKLRKNNKATPSARAGNTLIHFWFIN